MPTSHLENVIFVACPDMMHIAEGIRAILASEYPSIRPKVLSIEYQKFACGEYIARIPESVRNLDVLLFHAFQPDPMTSFLKMLIAMDAIRLGLPKSIKPILPFMPFQRQDRKDNERVPITAKLVWKLLDTNPAITSSITLDLHCEQEQAFSEQAIDNFPGVRIHARHLCEQYASRLHDLIIISPDLGSSKRTERLRDRILKISGVTVPVGIIDKRRPRPNVAEIKNYYGASPAGKTAVLYDDMIDTGGSSVAAADYMLQLGARDALLLATHGIFSPSKDKFHARVVTSAEEKLCRSGHKVVITNSIPRSLPYMEKHRDWLTVLPIEETFARVIEEAMRVGGSVSMQH
jgi:ribose-phosphate pyrophosphokinase